MIENKMVYKDLWQKVDKDYNIYDIDKNEIIKKIDSLTSNYTIHWYYYKDIMNEIPIIIEDNIAQQLQYYLLYKVYTKYVINYEKENNKKFTYIIKTRPDIYYTLNLYSLICYNHNKCTLYWDIVYLIPRFFSNKIITYVYFMAINPRLEDKLNYYKNYILHHNKRSILGDIKIIDSSLYLRFFLNLTKLIKYDTTKIGKLIRPNNIDHELQYFNLHY